jgi:hypothetical protein
MWTRWKLNSDFAGGFFPWSQSLPMRYVIASYLLVLKVALSRPALQQVDFPLVEGFAASF